jgi:hypothetical protein
MIVLARLIADRAGCRKGVFARPTFVNGHDA